MIITYFYTIKFLKPLQIFYRIYYLLLNHFGKASTFGLSLNKEFKYLNFSFRHQSNAYLGDGSFEFLNIKHLFPSKVDWEIMDHGKLWQYNLCYFGFLNSEISKEEGLHFINDFINSINALESALEPYPTSLRIINWIRFISKYQIADSRITDSLFEQTDILSKKIEYHIMGNHILENAFSLYMAGVFFKDTKLICKGRSLIIRQLNEQIMNDGAHFEQSAMYHQIMLFRLLECIDVLDSNERIKEELMTHATKMLGWLNSISFKAGDIPLVNDAAKGIAPSTKELNQFAGLLGIGSESRSLGESGYRMYRKKHYECLIDVGGIAAVYQPGHTHADALSFILYINNKPILVDTGTSTYSVGSRRQTERSTFSHNTVSVGSKNQSNVWGGFRVAQRAKVKVFKEIEGEQISACHSGYKAKHTRTFNFGAQIKIIDTYELKNEICVAHFHFHPDVSVQIIKNKLVFIEGEILFENALTINNRDFYYAEGFNQLTISKKIEVSFSGALSSFITIF